MNFIHLSHDRVTLDIDRDISTALLLVFIGRWGRLFTRRYCSTFGSLLSVHFDPYCSGCQMVPFGPQWSAVVLFDRGYPSFGNFDSSIPTDVLRVKSYMDSLFDPMFISLRVTIINLTLLQIGICPVSLRWKFADLFYWYNSIVVRSWKG